MLFFSYMVEDQSPNGPSYVEFLVHVHRQIQIKMASWLLMARQFELQVLSNFLLEYTWIQRIEEKLGAC